MGRWRPPERPGSKYITPAGAARLRAELDQLWRNERPQVTQAVSEAAAQGDRSENAEYTYGKKRLREIDRRVRFLRQRLAGIVIVTKPPADLERVFFGAWVELEDDTGARHEHRIVGPDEFDMDPCYLSMDAPLGRTLLGKRLDAELTVRLPAGERVYTIVGIRYEAAAR
ncbi:MAG TPA: transcription elongation factor GreB [Steroidobacteraceae bacterium]|nr:transcription elongation factor GreB [Steroidobacteraceae bacterium]